MKHALACVLYLALAIAFTWPMAVRLETAVADEGDPLHLSWILDWDVHALTHAPLRVFDAPVFHPAKYPLAFSENLIGVAALALPFHLLGFGPVAIYNIALLLGITLAAAFAYLAAWVLTRRFAPSLMAGLLYGFVPYRFGHLEHLQIVWSAGLALLIAAIFLYRRAPTAAHAALVAGALASNALMNIYNMMFGAVALALSLLLIAIAERRDARFWLRLVAAGAIAAIALVPILAPYWIVSKKYGLQRIENEARDGSARPYDWLVAPGGNRLYGAITDPELRRPERQLFPGLMAIALSLCALLLTPRVAASDPSDSTPRRWQTTAARTLNVLIVLLGIGTYLALVNDVVEIGVRPHAVIAYRGTTGVMLLLVASIVARFAIDGTMRRALQRSRFPLELWIAAIWIAIGFFGSLGMDTAFHRFLFEYVPGFRATRTPARWAMVTYTGLAPWAAWGMAKVATRWWRTAALFALALFDVAPHTRWVHTLTEPSQVDRWIAREKAGPVYLLPVSGDTAYLTIFRSTVHHQPMFNGLSSFDPPMYVRLMEHPYDRETLDVLEKNGCRFVVVRPEWCRWEAPPIFAWLKDSMARGRLAFVRRFDYGSGGDWVFAVTRNERSWRALAAAPVADAAGFTRDQELARLLAGLPTYGGITFGRTTVPKPNSEIIGPLEIYGMAFSPFGVREVNALIDNARIRIPVPLFERADFSSAYPFYPRTPRPAFALRIPQRPKGVWRYTDVQIEIIDGRGQATRLRDAPITWK
jgi:hypothetical protein